MTNMKPSVHSFIACNCNHVKREREKERQRKREIERERDIERERRVE